MKESKILLLIASLSGFLAVAIGAFGAHALKKILDVNNRVDVFETGVKYQMFHTLAILGVALLLFLQPHRMYYWSGICFSIGILIFSGSLYILALSNVGKWGAVTPIGGLFFLAGWLILGLGVFKN